MSEGPTHPKPPPRVAKKAPPQKKDIPVPPKEAPKDATPNAPPSSLPFIPVAQMPTNEDAILNNLMVRELTYPSAPEEPDSRAIMLLKDVVKGVQDGTTIKSFKAELELVTANQVEKAQIIEAVLNQLNVEKALDWTLIEYAATKVIKRAVLNGKMNSGEAIVVWSKAQGVIKECNLRLDKTKPLDSAMVVNKIDIHTQAQESVNAEVWAGTTPQGREIIRKKLHALHKRIAEVDEKPLQPGKAAKRN